MMSALVALRAKVALRERLRVGVVPVRDFASVVPAVARARVALRERLRVGVVPVRDFTWADVFIVRG